MENRSHALAAGIFTILLGICSAVAIWWLGQTDESTTTYVLETRRNVTGLNVQAQVRYRGIRAGKVTAIEPDDGDPRVILVQINISSLTGKDGEPARLALRPTLFDTLGEKAGDIVTQISAVSLRLGKLLDERNLQNLSRTLDNVATASESLREMPVILASMREVLSENNRSNLRQILVQVEKTVGEAAPLTREMRDLVKSMDGMSRRVEQLAGSVGNEMTRETLPRANELMRELTANSRQLARLLEGLENNPQMLIFGRGGGLPGPGEASFSAPAKQGETK
jgi:phospholipid/cholesterol/gamma-HCH transport system substrate-binding protein